MISLIFGRFRLKEILHTEITASRPAIKDTHDFHFQNRKKDFTGYIIQDIPAYGVRSFEPGEHNLSELSADEKTR